MRRDAANLVQVGPPIRLPAPAPDVIRILSPLVTAQRRARIEQVAAMRTTSVIPVLDGLTDPHNISAILRSADAFGVQQVRVIDGPQGFEASEAVARGAHRWIDVLRYRDAKDCADDLKRAGVVVVTAAPGGRLKPEQLSTVSRLAIVFGNEHGGVGEAMRSAADDTYEVPMVGFVESLNVSVAAAITLYGATRGRSPEADPEVRATWVARFLMNSVRDAERIVREHRAAPAFADGDEGR